jgi:hypothetical protein
VEQRSEPRIPVDAEITVEVLGDHPRRLTAELMNISSRGMRLATRHPIAHDAALRINVDGDLYLGEVTHCVAEGGRYTVGVALFNVMRDAAAVSERLNRMLQPR